MNDGVKRDMIGIGLGRGLALTRAKGRFKTGGMSFMELRGDKDRYAMSELNQWCNELGRIDEWT